ncbi:hypothetical protein ACWT_4201 [Actinoplanes sp. SE50]|uniref:hypothetical protein n=1 Tax=unclassified Actinoplanes TaxID=2626549 RepID=UPI00023EC2C9|nr:MULTISPECIES: hypothetical protein [unclassified Actinoplanes]AEV85221.1 hypothetical protein ACPL_4330 [Actinoplanes sp. SE50/110]ATO83616.1 hypothetical protein ACWT_4201 [Actinoplanes sp. SE50]SLM01024.1 hypothetical protein ACSP50_4257 [Actinoplanes sp. SE50/110]
MAFRVKRVHDDADPADGCRAELDAHPQAVADPRRTPREHGTITLLHSVRETTDNHARVLADHLSAGADLPAPA